MKKYLYVIKNSMKESHRSPITFVITLTQPIIQIYGYMLFYAFLTKSTSLFALPKDIVIYYLFILVVSTIDLARFGNEYQQDIINESYLNIDKLPISPYLYYLLKSIGANCIVGALLLISSIIILTTMNYPIQGILLFIPAAIIAFSLAHCIYFILTSFTFYFESLHPWLFSILMEFFSGKLIPLYLIPQPLQTLLFFLPFSYAFGAIATNISKGDYVGILVATLIAAGWMVVGYLVAQYVWKKGSYFFQENN